MMIPAVRHRFTVTDYHLMREAGIRSEDDRVEIISTPGPASLNTGSWTRMNGASPSAAILARTATSRRSWPAVGPA